MAACQHGAACVLHAVCLVACLLLDAAAARVELLQPAVVTPGVLQLVAAALVVKDAPLALGQQQHAAPARAQQLLQHRQLLEAAVTPQVEWPQAKLPLGLQHPSVLRWQRALEVSSTVHGTICRQDALRLLNASPQPQGPVPQHNAAAPLQQGAPPAAAPLAAAAQVLGAARPQHAAALQAALVLAA